MMPARALAKALQAGIDGANELKIEKGQHLLPCLVIPNSCLPAHKLLLHEQAGISESHYRIDKKIGPN